MVKSLVNFEKKLNHLKKVMKLFVAVHSHSMKISSSIGSFESLRHFSAVVLNAIKCNRSTK